MGYISFQGATCASSFFVSGGRGELSCWWGRALAVVGGIVYDRGTPNTVNPCDRTVRTNKVMFMSNRLPVSTTAKIVTRNTRTRTHRSLRGVGRVLRRTNLDVTGVIGAAIFLTSVSLFTSVGGMCTACFSNTFPTHSTITIGTLPGSTLMRVRYVTIHWRINRGRATTSRRSRVFQRTFFLYDPRNNECVEVTVSFRAYYFNGLL